MTEPHTDSATLAPIAYVPELNADEIERKRAALAGHERGVKARA